MDDPRDQIARLEARIEALTDSLERCRKIDLASKIAVAAGLAWIALMTLGAMSATLLSLAGAIAATLGGIVLFGSNSSTWKQTAAAIGEAEALRAELIGGMELRLVGEEPAE